MAAHNQQHENHHEHDPGSMYKEKWVQELIQQLKDFVAFNYAWLGLEAEKSQRVLDYACGNGTIAEGLARICPKTVFQGIDILPTQVERFHDAAIKLLGKDSSRMFAIVDDLVNPSPTLKEPSWYDFDMAITSMALHHFSDPVDMLRRLAERVKSGGTVVVADWLNDMPMPRNVTEDGESKKSEPYHPSRNANPDDMKDIHGTKIWAGFTLESIEESFTAAGLKHVEIKLHPQLSKMPESLRGDKQIFYAKAYVP